MPTEEQLQHGFTIGDWEVLPARRMLRRGEQEISPEPKVFGVLMSLAKRGGDVVTRDELIDEVWGGRTTGDEPINRCISQLRGHLGDHRPYRYIKPVTGSGYLLQAEIVLPRGELSTPAPDDAAVPSRRLWPAIFAIAVVATVAFVFLEPDAGEPGPVRSIVVLPFETAQQQEYLGSGFRDELANALQQIGNLSVKTARDTYANRTAEEIGRLFSVDSVLRGNVQQSGEELKVSYEVSDGRTGTLIAASGVTDNVERVFDVQERLARQVRDDLFGGPPQHLVSASRPSNFDAYTSYLRGLYEFERRGASNLEIAIGLFEDTIAMDSRFGPAYLQLATATALMPAYLGADPDESNAQAIRIVEEGITVDDSISAAAGAVFGFVYHSQKDWAKSELAYQQATTAEVVDANAFNWYSRMLASVGRLDASLEQILLAWEMDPDNAVINSRVALTYFWVGDTKNAAEFFQRARRLGAGNTTHLLGHSMFLADQGDIDGAGELATLAAQGAGFATGWIDAVLEGIADPELADEGLLAINDSVALGRITPQIEIVSRTMLGDLDGAMRVARLLEEPGEAFEMELLWLPQFRALRERPDFLELMEDLGVAEYWALHGCEFSDTDVVCPAS